MATTSGEKRKTRVSRIIHASRPTIFQAFLDPEAVASWLPPDSMKCQVHAFDRREGGIFRMSLTYLEPAHMPRGKTTEDTDTFQGRFAELVPNERVVQVVEFETNDPALTGPMIITWILSDTAGGTEVTVLYENEPEGIRPEDHEAGGRSTLANLAAFTERQHG